MTLYRRGRIWWTEFEVNEKTYRRSTGETVKFKALRIEQRMLSETYDVKTLGKLRDLRLGEAINRYAETVILKKSRLPNGGLRKPTKNTIGYLHRLEVYFGRNTPLAHLCRPGVLADFNQALLRSMKPISANKYLAILGAMLNRSYEWGAIEYRPKIPLNRVRWSRSRFLSEDEEAGLIKHCPAQIRPFVEFILDTGARKEEARTMTWSQVELDRKPRPAVQFIDTKNGESRVVPLPRRSANNLRRMRRQQEGRTRLVFVHPASRDIYRNDGSGLYAKMGELVPISALQQTWELARSKAGLPDCRLHDLRHTYASRLIRRGVPMFYVARLLGHKTIAMTMRYSHLAPLDLDRAVSVLDN